MTGELAPTLDRRSATFSNASTGFRFGKISPVTMPIREAKYVLPNRLLCRLPGRSEWRRERDSKSLTSVSRFPAYC